MAEGVGIGPTWAFTHGVANRCNTIMRTLRRNSLLYHFPGGMQHFLGFYEWIDS